MNDRTPKLLDAVLVAWTKSLPPPYGSGEFSSAKDGATDCNRFVNEVAEKLDFHKFRGLTANEIADYIGKNAAEWQEVDGRSAQFHASAGALVLASWKNPDPHLHGHVCVVIPGRTTVSGRWASDDVPRVANVSRPELCTIASWANYAFPEKPSYHVLRSSIEGAA